MSDKERIRLANEQCAWPTRTKNTVSTSSDSEDEDMRLLLNDENNFLSNYSSERLSFFMCKAVLPTLVTLLASLSWLPVILIGVQDTGVSIGIGLAYTFLVFIYEVLAQGILE